MKTAEFSWSKIRNFLKESIEKSPVIQSKIENTDNGNKSDRLDKVQIMDIKLKDVSFAYSNRPDVTVLRNVCLDIPHGKVTALVSIYYIYVYMYIKCIYIHTYMYVYVYMYIYTNTCIHICICVMHIYLSILICIIDVIYNTYIYIFVNAYEHQVVYECAYENVCDLYK
jgi:hypothetical protein